MANSTIIPKKKQLACGHFDYAFSKNKCKQCASIDSFNKRKALASDAPKVRGLYNPLEDKEAGSMQSLINDLDRVFSLYIRIKYANSKGIVTCFCCHRPLHYLKITNGHFIFRRHKATRFMEENCYPQCEKCNNAHNENQKPFADAIEAYKPGTIEYLYEQQNVVYKYTIDELKQLLIIYQGKLKLVQSKLENK